ncbi:HpcH/HpaI aldolase/citrate lyase family protein [Novosphingobium sp. P6W]|uniref:HpcH/HpaI aldolase family protein n=1 Tax=Novosphingobium sp. P6W TaxID=1609758 RepID=UPI000AC96C45|nr:aldolase/citrate lyase family protein [Novosphingobium sp. P6W]
MTSVKPSLTSASDMRAALKEGGMISSWFAMGSVPLIEIGALDDFDTAIIDLQHGLWDRMTAHLAVSVLGSKPAIMRVAANTMPAIGEALDSGAEGVLVPLVETAEQARAAVASATFPEEGVRSGGGVRPLSEGFSRYHKRSVNPLIGMMIETAIGVQNAAEIAAVSGVDFVFIGTGDLALSLGCFPKIDERHEAACQSVFDACKEAGIPCGIFTATAEAAAARMEQGYAMSVAANDVDVVLNGFSQAAKIARREVVLKDATRA